MNRFSLLLLCANVGIAGSLTAAPAPIPKAPRDHRTEMQKTFPDGVEYDFGKVVRGSQAEHVFRIVNRSAVPLHIVSVRRGG